jgi:maleylpyruvate isomerase
VIGWLTLETNMAIILHGFWRSGAAYRVRIALNLKGLAYDQVAVDLRKGEHKSQAFRALQPQGLVPALVDDGVVIQQSPAIFEWLEEKYPSPALLPSKAADRAVVRAMSAIVACDIHPLNNLRVLNSLRDDLRADQAAVDAWISRWITSGFDALEVLIEKHGGEFCFGDAPSFADCCLVPQVYGAQRFNVGLSAYPRIVAVAARCNAMSAFAVARPEAQPDAPGEQK